MEDLSISRAWRARATGDTSSKKTNHYAIKKPLAEELTHIHRSTRHDHQQADGTALHFLNCFRRFHLFLRAERETIFAAWSHSGGAQTIEYFRFVRQLAIVALMDGERHVNDRTRNEHDHS